MFGSTAALRRAPLDECQATSRTRTSITSLRSTVRRRWRHTGRRHTMPSGGHLRTRWTVRPRPRALIRYFPAAAEYWEKRRSSGSGLAEETLMRPRRAGRTNSSLITQGGTGCCQPSIVADVRRHAPALPHKSLPSAICYGERLDPHSPWRSHRSAPRISEDGARRVTRSASSLAEDRDRLKLLRDRGVARS